MKDLTLEAIILDNKIEYHNQNFKEKIDRFKSVHEGKEIQISFEVIEKPEHFQFKYYYGSLLPDIAFTLGYRDIEYVDKFLLKNKFLRMQAVDGQVPKQYQKKGIICYTKEVEHINKDTGEITMVEQIDSYVPSKSALTFTAMKEYIEKCEELLFEAQGYIGIKKVEHDFENKEHAQKEALEIRQHAFIEKNLKKV
jgi:hypothetical protein